MTAEPMQANDYDRIAEAYSAENEINIYNAYYERPKMLELAGDVTGRRILDAGCGSGPLFAELRRVLAPGGRLIISVDHPFTVFAIHRRDGRDPATSRPTAGPRNGRWAGSRCR